MEQWLITRGTKLIITTSFEKSNKDNYIYAKYEGLTSSLQLYEMSMPLFAIETDEDGNFKNIKYVDEGEWTQASSVTPEIVKQVFNTKYGIRINEKENFFIDTYSYKYLYYSSEDFATCIMLMVSEVSDKITDFSNYDTGYKSALFNLHSGFIDMSGTVSVFGLTN